MSRRWKTWQTKHNWSKRCIKTGLTKKDAAAAVDAVFSSNQDTLKQGDQGFNNRLWYIQYVNVRSRRAVTPQTGAEIKIPASKVPAHSSQVKL